MRRGWSLAAAATMALVAALSSRHRGAAVEQFGPAAAPPGFSVASARSTGQLGYELGAAPPPTATVIRVDGHIRPGLRSGRAHVVLSGVECARLEASGAVVIDTLCCEWSREGHRGVQVLTRRQSFARLPPDIRRKFRAECTQRAGAPWP